MHPRSLAARAAAAAAGPAWLAASELRAASWQPQPLQRKDHHDGRRAMRHKDHRPDCAVQPPRLLLIPYVPNVIDVANPAATFRRRLPLLGQRTTLAFSSSLCAQGAGDNMGKQFRCAAL